jgi:phosphoribosylformimino-5-aminoimidazole carboxamide ribotide isomerase
VKQIVGGTLSDDGGSLKTNFVSDRPASWYANLYKRDGLSGGHIIMLGPGNEQQAREALSVYPNGLQLGGGVTIENARDWLEAGASHVIVTSWILHEGKVDWNRLAALVNAVGKDRLALDLSCRKKDGKYLVVTDRWQKFTDLEITRESLRKLGEFCSEFLVHAVDVEGKCEGVDLELVALLGEFAPLPVTYAGGASRIEDLDRVSAAGQGRVDLTIGSALDIFGGSGVKYLEAVAYNNRARSDRGASKTA